MTCRMDHVETYQSKYLWHFSARPLGRQTRDVLEAASRRLRTVTLEAVDAPAVVIIGL